MENAVNLNLSVKCPNCGANVELPAQCDFLSCSYCDSAFYVDLRGSVQCLWTPVRASSANIVPYIRRFLSEHELSAPVEIRNFEGIFLPFWVIQKGAKVLERSAFSLPYEGLQNFKIPSSQFSRVRREDRADASMNWLPPELPLDAAVKEWEHLFAEKSESVKAELRYAPIFTVEYEYENRRYRATMDGTSGKILPEEIPPSPLIVIDKKAIRLFLEIFVLFALTGALVPGFLLSIAASVGLGFLLYPFALKGLLSLHRGREAKI